MTSEQRVQSKYPKAQALYNHGYHYWGVFLDGRPRVVSTHPSGTIMSDPFSTGNSAANAWVNARKKLQQRGEL
jgi:hypothetical protein